jgi:hypothetical protein
MLNKQVCFMCAIRHTNNESWFYTPTRRKIVLQFNSYWKDGYAFCFMARTGCIGVWERTQKPPKECPYELEHTVLKETKNE